MIFDWDENKAAENLDKHGVSFREAASVFTDELSITEADDLHSVGEFRFLTVGMSNSDRLLIVAHTESEDENGETIIRIITARETTTIERKAYEEGD